MSKKTRYLLILSCFVFFLIASPIIVLYVKGIAFDAKTGNFYKTGILGIRTMPKDSTISLDGKVVKKTEGNIRFLKPKDYLIEISKEGYQTWSKQLNIAAGMVTWANPGNNKVNLFLADPTKLFSENEVSSLIKIDDKIYYTKQNLLIEQDLNQTVEKFSHSLPKDFSDFQISYLTSDAKILVLTHDQKTLLYDIENKTFIDSTTLLEPGEEVKYLKNNLLYTLNKNVFFEIDIKKNTKTELIKDVKNILFAENNFYYLKINANTLTLFTTPKINETGTIITEGLPNTEYAQIFSDFQKHIFVQLGNNLYRVSSKLILVGENIRELNFDKEHSGFTFISGPEFFWLNTEVGEPTFIHRSSLLLKSAYFLPEINYAFVNKNNQLSALELDLRDKQNEFLLYQGKDVKNYVLSNDGKHMAVLDNNTLHILEIR